MDMKAAEEKLPWGQPALKSKSDFVSFAEIMSEELANKMQKDEEKNMVTKPEMDKTCTEMTTYNILEDDSNCSDDFLMAKMLQHEYDREHDQILRRQQAKINGNDKVSISFDNYLYSDTLEDSDTDSENSYDEDIREEVTYKRYNKRNPDFGASGIVVGGDGNVISKHDQEVVARKNTARILQLPPDLPTGDAVDVKVNNQVYNALKQHGKKEEKRQWKMKDKEEKATCELAVDGRTRLLLFQMVNSLGLVRAVGGVVATGKEALVLHAFAPSQSHTTECAIKVYKTVLSEFRNRFEYVKDDFRFNNPRKVIRIWAEKERLNLNRMNRAGLRCPKVISLRKHILVMSFIGYDRKPAPQLRDVHFASETEMMAAFSECEQFVNDLYRKCRLVHGDLSEFNILYWDSHCWFIDVAQAVDTSHPKSLLFLARDCTALIAFFRRLGLTDQLPTERQLFNQVTDLSIESDDTFMAEVQDFSVQNRSVQNKKDKANPADCTLRKYREEKAIYFDDQPLSSATSVIH